MASSTQICSEQETSSNLLPAPTAKLMTKEMTKTILKYEKKANWLMPAGLSIGGFPESCKIRSITPCFVLLGKTATIIPEPNAKSC